MKRYTYVIAKLVWMTATVEVDAEDDDEAEELVDKKFEELSDSEYGEVDLVDLEYEYQNEHDLDEDDEEES